MKIQAAKSEQLTRIEKLYLEAFPEDERKPFKVMLQKVAEGQMEMLALEKAGEFVGLAITIKHKDLVLLDYFAIENKWRGQGIGGEAIELLKQHYAEKRFLLEIEIIDEAAENNAERIRRKAFYLRHGMCEAKIYVCLFGVEMEVLTAQCEITFEEYYSVYADTFGKTLASHVKQSQ